MTRMRRLQLEACSSGRASSIAIASSHQSTLCLLFCCSSSRQVKELLVSSISEPTEALQTIAATTSAEGSPTIAAGQAKATAAEEITSKETPLDRQ